MRRRLQPDGWLARRAASLAAPAIARPGSNPGRTGPFRRRGARLARWPSESESRSRQRSRTAARLLRRSLADSRCADRIEPQRSCSGRGGRKPRAGSRARSTSPGSAPAGRSTGRSLWCTPHRSSGARRRRPGHRTPPRNAPASAIARQGRAVAAAGHTRRPKYSCGWGWSEGRSSGCLREMATAR